MAIADEIELVVRKARYYPELIPFIYSSNLATGDNPVFALKTPSVSYTYPVRSGQLSCSRDTDVMLKLTADVPGMLELEAGALKALGELTDLEYLSARGMSLSLNADAPVALFNLYLGLWVLDPSVAQRILWDYPLSNGDLELARKRGVRESVEKGVLPFPILYQLEREFIGTRETYADIIPNVAGGTTTPVWTISARGANEVVVLEGVAADPTGLVLADGVEYWITRDDDRDLWQLPVLPMSLNYDLPCWLPALDKLEIKVYAVNPQANFEIRAVVGRYRLTDLLRARFGLEASQEAIEATRAGVVP